MRLKWNNVWKELAGGPARLLLSSARLLVPHYVAIAEQRLVHSRSQTDVCCKMKEMQGGDTGRREDGLRELGRNIYLVDE